MGSRFQSIMGFRLSPFGGGAGVAGPAGATDNALARFDGATGQVIQNSVVILDDTGNISGLGTLGSGAITSTGLLQVTLAGNTADFKNTTDSSSVQVAIFEGDRATMADNDEAYITLRLSNDGGTQTEVARITWAVPDVNVGTSVDGRLDFSVMTAGSLAKELQLSGADLSPSASDGLALGTASLPFSDIFLATGAVIDFGNANVVLTHSSGIWTMGTGEMRITTVGTNTASVVTVGGTQSLTNKTINGNTITSGTGVLTLGAGKTLTISNTLTLAGTDSTVMTFPTTTATIARTDAANTFTGASTASAWVLTSPTITTKISPTSDDGAPLGDTTHNFSDLFLASGAVVNFANSNVVITHSSGILTMGTGELRISTPGTNTASVPTLGATQTFTNKYITPQLQSVADAGGTFTPVAITNDMCIATALSQATTIAAPTGSPVQGEKLIIRLKDNGTARALTWNAIFRAVGVTLPTTTVLSKTHYIGCIYNSTDTKWDAIAVVVEA